jgi:hypothetical protein
MNTDVLTPEELGLDLEEDSEDITDEDVEEATDTDDVEDFTRKALSFSRLESNIHAKIRRKSGVLYTIFENEIGNRLVLRTEWFRK